MARNKALDYLQPLEQRTRGVEILDALAEMIECADLGVGDRLPPEVSLAATLGVGRSSMREALNRWEGLGVIRRRRGDGTYLVAKVQASRSLVPTMVRLEGEALLRLFEVRRTLENEVVRKATLNATKRQRAEVGRLCNALLVEVYGRRPWRPADAAFHGAIYDAAGNPMFGLILSRLDQAIERSPESPFGRDEFGADSFAPHRVLADAIMAGDADAACAAINRVLDVVMDEIRVIIKGDASAPG